MSEHDIGTPKDLSKHLSPVRNYRLSGSNQKVLVPPVLHEVGKLAAGVAAVATGSSTGNPRNKHALQPGHSLMDWIRLGSSGKDLTGVGAQAGQLSVTLRELAQHNKPTDAWLAIRGKVYNVSHYLSFHPGGVDELLRGVGKDATTLFDEIHAWVNYESLLQKCYIGRLVSIDPEIDTRELFFGKEEPKSNKNLPKLLPSNKVTPLTNVQLQEPEAKPSQELKPPPRFDWIQKTDYITLIFYSGPFANPKIEIVPPNVDNTLIIYLTSDLQVFVNEVTFLHRIQWPCQIKVNYETGKVEVQFRKSESKIWDNYGVLKQKTEVPSVVKHNFKCKYTVVNKLELNYNTSLLELKKNDENKLTVPLGKHVRVFINIQGHDLSRSYTPVPSSIFTKFKSQTFLSDTLCLLIKSYANGALSKHICSKKKGDVLEISEPLGTFDLSTLNSRETFLLVAAGTGITPMLGILVFLLERRIRKCKSITLVFFNKTEEDILLKDQLENLQHDDNRFKVHHVLSQPDSKWPGLKGQASKELFKNIIEKHLLNIVYKESDIFTLICGPTPFTNLSQTLLMEIGFTEEQMHLFLG
ncbi:hypothetical protein RN001_013294 [Aquatica leii]|uniref:Cytochrome b5 reductase 4 n=1 Tax=Aquatica leii TaxID=1421715 RepID=A0AAN7PQF8_9COLE|nr:hypothetical protein RN001_013294 [Aquatica leii]